MAAPSELFDRSICERFTLSGSAKWTFFLTFTASNSAFTCHKRSYGTISILVSLGSSSESYPESDLDFSAFRNQVRASVIMLNLRVSLTFLGRDTTSTTRRVIARLRETGITLSRVWSVYSPHVQKQCHHWAFRHQDSVLLYG